MEKVSLSSPTTFFSGDSVDNFEELGTVSSFANFCSEFHGVG